jgi:hypothetical protein
MTLVAVHTMLETRRLGLQMSKEGKTTRERYYSRSTGRLLYISLVAMCCIYLYVSECCINPSYALKYLRLPALYVSLYISLAALYQSSAAAKTSAAAVSPLRLLVPSAGASQSNCMQAPCCIYFSLFASHPR